MKSYRLGITHYNAWLASTAVNKPLGSPDLANLNVATQQPLLQHLNLTAPY